MNVLVPIYKKHTDLIFKGIKIFDFKQNIPKKLHKGDKIYFYECKRNAGRGMVVGEAVVNEMIQIPEVNTGTYVMLPYYADLFGSEEEKRQVHKAMGIHLSDYNDSIVLSYLFDNWTLDYMISHDDVPGGARLNPLWMDVKKYNEVHRKSRELCNKCDKWASETGFYDNYGHSDWKYMIEFCKVCRYEKPIKISEFKRPCGDPIKKIRGWCYIDKVKKDLKNRENMRN